MDRDPHAPSGILAQVRELLGLGGEDRWGFDALLGRTRRELLELARRLGLSGLQGLDKETLARRFQQALQTLRAVRQSPDAAEEESPDVPRKFDLGRPADEAGEVEHIPWSYGQDRVTAMVVDPERLYVYWEVTDEAIERARGGLGPGGAGAWLNLRLHDVTNRIFDGTNAHDYVDHAVERTDRQWFFTVGRPASTAIVEVGLKSHEGYFVRIARSGRADFPRSEPSPASQVEWLTVRTAAGDFEPPVLGGLPIPPTRGETAAPHVDAVRVWDIRRTHAGEWPTRDESFARAWEWMESNALTWEGPVVQTTWEAGPFSFPVESPVYVEERDAGEVTVYSAYGKTHVVYGPWEVVIRGLGARAERRILARWEMRRTWVAHGPETGPVPAERQRLGASERRWLAASEVRLGGASELYRIGASELRWRGASEWQAPGASERRHAGASERRLGGASERAPSRPARR